MNDTNRRLSADDIEALLPWYATGTLGAQEANQVAAALAADAELVRRLDLVRAEMTETIADNEALGVPSARAAARLFGAIDIAISRDRRTARAATSGSLTGWLADMFSPRTYAFAAGAAILLVMLEAGVIARFAMQDRAQPGSTYLPASLPATQIAGAFAKVKFAPEANMTEVSRFLDGRKAEIVGGPHDGFYRVRISTDIVPKEDVDHLAREFQSASPLVASAEAD
jgi:anti-sigma-K factor RskA